VQIVLVDDHPVIREALRGVFAIRKPPIDVVGEASNAREAIAIVESQQPDLVLMDLLLPGSNGVFAIRDIRRVGPKCRVLIYTALTEPAFAVDALAAGAHGYAVKSDPVEELLTGIERVERGQIYLSPTVRDHLDGVRPGDMSAGLAGLSKREREIFDLIVKGHTTVELAAQLFISVKTVETHRSRINKKLGVHSTAQLIRFAALNNLVSF
jgi:two-component system, NarL family, response regulator NreC